MNLLCILLIGGGPTLSLGGNFIWSGTMVSRQIPNQCLCDSWNDFWKQLALDVTRIKKILWSSNVADEVLICESENVKLLVLAMAVDGPQPSKVEILCGNRTSWFTGPDTFFSTRGSVHKHVAHLVQYGQMTSVSEDVNRDKRFGNSAIWCTRVPSIKPCSTGSSGFVNNFTVDYCINPPPSQTQTITVITDDKPQVLATETPKVVTYEDAYYHGVGGTPEQCASWKSFWKTVPLNRHLVISLSTSRVPQPYTCKGLSAVAIVLSQYTTIGLAFMGVLCDNRVRWSFSSSDSTAAIAFGVNPSECPNGAIRPCETNWGGFDKVGSGTGSFSKVSCNAPNQTFYVSVEIGGLLSDLSIPDICNASEVIRRGVGNGTVTCDCTCRNVAVACEKGYVANGTFSLYGRYNCTGGIWHPAVPMCTNAPLNFTSATSFTQAYVPPSTTGVEQVTSYYVAEDQLWILPLALVVSIIAVNAICCSSLIYECRRLHVEEKTSSANSIKSVKKF